MNKPTGWDSAPAKNGGGRDYPPPGAYVFGIIKGESVLSRNNNEMIVLSLDIAEGEFKGFYRQFSDDVEKDKLLKHRRVTNTEGSLPYFKGDIKAIEESNPGYKFNFDEKTLRGKVVGGMLREEEYEKQGGEIGNTTKIAFLCSVEKARSGTLKVPEKKCIDFTPSHEPPVHDTNDDDLPF